MSEREGALGADIHFSAKPNMEHKEGSQEKPGTELVRELASIRTRVLTDEKPATRFDALFIIKAELADIRNEKPTIDAAPNEKELKKLYNVLTELTSGHAADVSETNREKVFAYLEAHRKHWADMRENPTAEENAALFKAVSADLARSIKKETTQAADTENRPSLSEYTYAPNEAATTVTELREQPDFAHLQTFITAVGTDFDAQNEDGQVKEYTIRHDAIKHAKETTQKLVDGERISSEAAFGLGQLLQQHINYLKGPGRETPDAEESIAALTTIGEKIGEQIKKKKKKVTKFKIKKK